MPGLSANGSAGREIDASRPFLLLKAGFEATRAGIYIEKGKEDDSRIAAMFLWEI
jgi:hypothetical protein